MKLEFNLRPRHEIILLALYNPKEYRSVPYDKLAQVVELLFPEERWDLATDIEAFVSLGLVIKHSFMDRMSFPLAFEVRLTEEGKRIADIISKGRIPTLRPHSGLQTSIFVACAFGHDEIDDLYDQNFSPAIESLEYKAIRVDMTEPHQTITEKIMEGITDAACIVADLTYARPSVYFEVGYAVGLGIPLVITCRQDHFHGTKDSQRVHFDLEQYKISYWTKGEDGRFKWPSEAMEPGKRLATILSSHQ